MKIRSHVSNVIASERLDVFETRCMAQLKAVEMRLGWGDCAASVRSCCRCCWWCFRHRWSREDATPSAAAVRSR